MLEGKMLTLAQVAEHLQVSEKTIYRYLEAKELKGTKLGRAWRIAEADLRDFIQKRSNIPQ